MINVIDTQISTVIATLEVISSLYSVCKEESSSIMRTCYLKQQPTSIYEATLLFFTAKNMLLKCQKRRCVLFR